MCDKLTCVRVEEDVDIAILIVKGPGMGFQRPKNSSGVYLLATHISMV
jgi:hypothetical protein